MRQPGGASSRNAALRHEVVRALGILARNRRKRLSISSVVYGQRFGSGGGAIRRRALPASRILAVARTVHRRAGSLPRRRDFIVSLRKSRHNM